MENTVQKTKTKKVKPEDIKKAYMEHVLVEGKEPNSIFLFAKQLKISETDFYEHFNSFSQIDKTIWSDWLTTTLERLESDETYAQYSIREKLLAFLYTWFEIIKENRSYALTKTEHFSNPVKGIVFLETLKEHYKKYILDLLAQGKESNEIASRPLAEYYDRGFWVQFLVLNRFWLEDDSKGFEKTDEAVEKSVNFVFDLIGKGAVDSFLDLARFLIKTKSPVI